MSDFIGKDTDALDPDTIEALARSVRSEEPPPTRRKAMHERVLGRVRARTPAGTVTVRAEEGQWVCVAPGIEIKVLNQDRTRNEQTTLWRLEPGAVLPAHDHESDEECLVLEGEIHFEDFYVRTGDFHLAKRGRRHPAIETTDGALLMIRGELHEHMAAGV